MPKYVSLFRLNSFATIPKQRTTAALRHPSKHLQFSYFSPRMMKMSTQALQNWEAHYEQMNCSAANDFRSDTVTTPSGPMLTSILSNATGLGDDVFSEDQPTNFLEEFVANLTGMGSAVFVLSGTMGNQIAIRSLLKQPPYSVICNRQSHLFQYECGTVSAFSQAQMIPVIPKNSAHMSLEDIIPNVVPDDGDTHCSPTRVISVENTIGGKTVPLEEVKRISDYARTKGISIHIDGARLWNACYPNEAPLTTTESAENARRLLKSYCSLADTVSLCLSKSLGAPGGSVLAFNSRDVALRARHFRKAMGGGMRQIGVLTAPGRVAIESVFLSGEHLPRANAIARRLENTWKSLGGHIQPGLDQETNMVWLDLNEIGITDEEFVRIVTPFGVKVSDGRIVTHYRKYLAVLYERRLPSFESSEMRMWLLNQFINSEITEKAVAALEDALKVVAKRGREGRQQPASQHLEGENAMPLS